MENQTRFDLNAAIENWRQELAAQPNLASDDRRELEMHLRDSITEFQNRGLNDQESFWLARQRVGQPPQIAEEFTKADPTKIWRDRVFWIIVGVGVYGFATDIIIPTEENLLFFTNSHWFWEAHLGWILMIQWLVMAVLLASGRFAQSRFLARFFQSRLRLATFAIVLIGISFLMPMEAAVLNVSGTVSHTYFWWISHAWHGLANYYNIGSILSFLILLVWLMPPQNRKTPRHA
jgi:hypothetical protein